MTKQERANECGTETYPFVILTPAGSFLGKSKTLEAATKRATWFAKVASTIRKGAPWISSLEHPPKP